MKKYSCICMMFLFFMVFLTGCKEVSNTGAEKITVGVDYSYSGIASVLIGLDKGFFEQENLEIEYVILATPAAAISAVTTKAVDFAYLNSRAYPLLLNAEVGVVSLQSQNMAEAIFVGSESGILSVADLKGRKVGVEFGTSEEEFLKMVLHENDMTTEDLHLIHYDKSGALTALEEGKIEALVVSEHFIMEVQNRFGKSVALLVESSDFAATTPSLASWIARCDAIETEKEVVQHFVNAVLKSQNYWERNIEETCRLVSDLLEVPLADLLLRQYDTDIFTVAELRKMHENGETTLFYTEQNESAKVMTEGVAVELLGSYFYFEFMENTFQLWG